MVPDRCPLMRRVGCCEPGLAPRPVVARAPGQALASLGKAHFLLRLRLGGHPTNSWPLDHTRGTRLMQALMSRLGRAAPGREVALLDQVAGQGGGLAIQLRRATASPVIWSKWARTARSRCRISGSWPSWKRRSRSSSRVVREPGPYALATATTPLSRTGGGGVEPFEPQVERRDLRPVGLLRRGRRGVHGRDRRLAAGRGRPRGGARRRRSVRCPRG